MYRVYICTNRITGATKEVSAISARDALAQVVGFIGISINGLRYRSGGWQTQEPYEWWREVTNERSNQSLN